MDAATQMCQRGNRMEDKKITNGKILLFLLVGVFLIYGMYWASSNLQKELNRPLNDYECSTAEECYNMAPACKTRNIDGKNCVRDGMTGGFFDNKIYYICEGFGKMTNGCVSYYSFEEWDKKIDEFRNDVDVEIDE